MPGPLAERAQREADLGRDRGVWRIGATVRVSLSPGEARGLRTAGCDGHGWLAAGAVEQPGMIELQVVSAVVGQGAGQQTLDDVHCLRQPFMTLAPAGPAGADARHHPPVRDPGRIRNFLCAPS